MVERLYKVAEVAEILGVGIDWVYRRIEKGELTVIELGDTRKNQRVPESALDAYLVPRTFGTKTAAVASLDDRRKTKQTA